MMRVALELLDFTGFLVDVGQETTARLTVETCGWNETETALGLSAVCPLLGVELHPIAPLLDGWVVGE
jgi:hypothetical protein